MLFKQIARSTAGLESGIMELKDIDSFAKSLKKHSGFVQACSLKAICCPEQPFTALEHALSALDQGSAFSKDLSLEFLIRLSARPQINKALDAVGLQEGRNEVLAIALADSEEGVKQAFEFLQSLGLTPKPVLLQKLSKNSAHIQKLYNIPQQELDALEDLQDPLCAAVIERIALTALQERSA